LQRCWQCRRRSPPGAPNTPAIEKVAIGQLQQTLAASPGKPDAELAQELSTFELTERLSSVLLTKLNAGIPGEKSRQALLLLADKSVFLDPPSAEIPPDPTPDAAATRQMLVKLVNYVGLSGSQAVRSASFTTVAPAAFPAAPDTSGSHAPASHS